jgi:hypothetical protein
MRLLDRFRSLFEGQPYLHRKSNLGDFVASELYEDLLNLGKSKLLVSRIRDSDCVLNTRNVTVGKEARRGDGTFGELVPGVVAITPDGFQVARGATANIQIGAETKILAKAMIKQIDRVIGDLERQVKMFQAHGGNPITVAFVGVNHSPFYISFEGERQFPTDGRRHKHPSQEAVEAEARLRTKASPHFDEFLILPFEATNQEPFPFKWKDQSKTELEYNALLTRVSRLYDTRFGT